MAPTESELILYRLPYPAFLVLTWLINRARPTRGSRFRIQAEDWTVSRIWKCKITMETLFYLTNCLKSRVALALRAEEACSEEKIVNAITVS